MFFNLLQIQMPVGALTSITHRVTGLFLALGIPFSVYILDLSLQGPQGYAQVIAWFDTFAFRLATIALFAAGTLATAVAGWGAELPDLERSRALYENHCIVCHTPKVHRRVPTLPLHTDDLRFIVALWTSQQGLRWSRDGIEDAVHFLDRTHYRFEK